MLHNCGMGEAERDELGENENKARDGEKEKCVAKVGDAVRRIFGGVIGGVVHGRLKDGFAFGEDGSDAARPNDSVSASWGRCGWG